MTRSTRLACGVAFCLLAWGLQTAVVGAHRLHPDEALYGHWGLLILSGRDAWLTTEPVYKPPLLPYLLYGSLSLLGPRELAVRLPGLLAGPVTAALTARLAWRLYSDGLVGAVAMATVALSPLAILLFPTGFTDPLMVALGLGGCVAAAEGRPGLAGLLAGLSFAAKQTGLFWAALVAWLVVAAVARGVRPARLAGDLLRAGVGLGLVLAAVAGWDQARVMRGAASFWQTGVSGYGGLRLIWPAEWSVRLRAWRDEGAYLLGTRLLDGALLAGAAALVWRAVRRRDWAGLFDLTLLVSSILYLLIHWLWAFPVWERYLLPLLPLLALLLGRTAAWARSLIAPRHRLAGWVVLAIVVAAMAAPASAAVGGAVPLGAGLDVYDGIEQVVDLLARQPPGSVLYHHWLGWHYGFYLFDGPLYLAYWPHPAWLARDVQAFGQAEPRYIVFPAWESSARVQDTLARIGYCLNLLLEARNRGGEVRFRVYRIEGCPATDERRVSIIFLRPPGLSRSPGRAQCRRMLPVQWDTDGHGWYGFSQISSVPIRETRVYPCPDFKLSGSQET